GPDEALQEPRPVRARHVDGLEIDPETPASGGRAGEQLGGRARLLRARELERGPRRAPVACLVAVAVARPAEVESGARPELDHVEGALVRDGEEGRQEPEAALHLVRLDALFPDEARDPVPTLLEQLAE